ncbi:unnamed protein product [Linum trigynum]|uniref:Uncharacterized protein n=1 Tax=Linum trigynum TaxID=586398 RepID=A0AAV2G418_9ROSI
MSPRTPLKRLCSKRLDAVMAEMDEQQPEEKSVLESLSQDILVLIQFILLSESLFSPPQQTLIAKESHSAYSTQRKFCAFRSPTIYYDSEINDRD